MHWVNNDSDRITVTQQHIDDGKVSGSYCPIALAIKDFDGVKDVKVCGGDVTVDYYAVCNDGDGEYLDFRTQREFLDLPDEARNFIHDFDKGYKVSPFTFAGIRPNL